MVEFHKPTLDDKKWINERISSTDDLSCEYTFGNIFTYTGKLDIYVADYANCLVTRCHIGDKISYCFPIGDGDIKRAVQFMLDDGEKFNNNFDVFGLTEKDVEVVNKLFPDKFIITEDRDGFDYVYKSEDLINLSGKKYQSKRNHISYFTRTFNWTYERMDESNFEDCYNMSVEWLKKNDGEYHDDLNSELKIIRCSLDNFEALDLVGGLIRVDGEVVAYTIGERMTDNMFCVHIEKAYSDIKGAYPIINQQFVKNELSQYEYIDREDDVGAENLRRAKLSYHPCFMLKKYEAVLK